MSIESSTKLEFGGWSWGLVADALSRQCLHKSILRHVECIHGDETL